MSSRPAQSVPAYTAAALTVVDGANLGDEIGLAEDLQHDDIYHLTYQASRKRLSIRQGDRLGFVIADDTELGKPGNSLHLDCCVTFMAPDGSTIDCIVAVEVDEGGLVEALFPIPLHAMQNQCDYRIIGIDRSEARRKFAQIGCASFTRGTRITLASAKQRAIEDLVPGDRILTRDAGPQEVRWIGQTTLRAEGAFAPILIKAGTLNNLGDLLVSPEHRLFIYQRHDALGAGRSEVLVRAQHLLNGTTVVRRTGGYVDYFQLLFDDHQIIYAEGIAAETMLVDGQTEPVLPDDLAKAHNAKLPGRDTGLRAEYELSERLARRPDAAELLRRASTR